jgi:hypothetical protein
VTIAAIAAGAGIAAATMLAPTSEVPPPTPIVNAFVLDSGVAAAPCPGGAADTELDPGAYVLALSKSQDNAFIAVRNPADLASVVWIAASAAEFEQGTSLETLPVGGCAQGVAAPTLEASPAPTAPPSEGTSETETPAPAPAPGPAPAPAPAPGPAPAPIDTQAPSLQVGAWNEVWICSSDTGFGPMSASISIVVGDNVGVTVVQASAGDGNVTVNGPSGSGTNRTFTVSRSGNTDANVVLSFVIKDAAGNTTSAPSPALPVYSPMNCVL